MPLAARLIGPFLALIYVFECAQTSTSLFTKLFEIMSGNTGNLSEAPFLHITLKVNMTRKCHSHRLQTNPRHHEDKAQTTDSHKTIKVKQPTWERSG